MTRFVDTYDALDVIQEARTYDAWDVLLAVRYTTSSYDDGDTQESYTGKERDEESITTANEGVGALAGLDYFGARTYAPAFARFVQVDPLMEKHPDFSPYNYVLNNPLALVDPDGRQQSVAGGHYYVDPATGIRAAMTAFYEVKHAAQRLLLNTTIGRVLTGIDNDKRWDVTYATDEKGNQIFQSERRQVPRGGVLSDIGNAALDVATVASANLAAGGGTGVLAARIPMTAFSGILRDAAKGRGNFGIGSATADEASTLGRAWVGDGYRTASNGALVSRNGLRMYRPPSFKPDLGRHQANFQQKFEGQRSNAWQTNGHLDINDL